MNQIGKRIGLFSYGSGLASSMFSIRVVSSVKEFVDKMNVIPRLESRLKVQPEEFEAV